MISFLYFKISRLIQCVTLCFFVIVCEIYKQILSEHISYFFSVYIMIAVFLEIQPQKLYI